MENIVPRIFNSHGYKNRSYDAFMTGAPFFSLITSSGADLEIGFFCLILLYSLLNILYPRSTGTKIFCHLTPFDLHME